MANVKFVPPRVPLVDLKTGQITREWYLLFASLFSGSDGPGSSPDPIDDMISTLTAPVDGRPDAISQELVTLQSPQLNRVAESLDILERMTALYSMADQDHHGRLDDVEALLATAYPPAQQGQPVSSGSYTPTITAIGNVSASTPHICFYHQIGKIVSVWGAVEIRPTTVSLYADFTISLPIASTFSVADDGWVMLTGNDFAGSSGSGTAYTTTNTMRAAFIAQGTTLQYKAFSFAYVLKP